MAGSSRSGAPSRSRTGRRGRCRSSPSWAPSTCRSSSSRSIGGTPCISPPRCSASAGRPSTPRCWCRSWSWRSAFTLLGVTPSPVRHAHRDPAPPRPHAHHPRGRAPRRAGGLKPCQHAVFIAGAYAVTPADRRGPDPARGRRFPRCRSAPSPNSRRAAPGRRSARRDRASMSDTAARSALRKARRRACCSCCRW